MLPDLCEAPEAVNPVVDESEPDRLWRQVAGDLDDVEEHELRVPRPCDPCAQLDEVLVPEFAEREEDAVPLELDVLLQGGQDVAHFRGRNRRPWLQSPASTREPMVGESSGEPEHAEGRGKDSRRNQRILSSREVPEDCAQGEVQGDRDHGHCGNERDTESWAAPAFSPAERDDGRMDEREESEEREARDDRNRLDRQEDEEARTGEGEGHRRGRHLAPANP